MSVITTFDFATLQRWPDVEAPNLHAVDASDRLILDESAELLRDSGPGEVVVIGDTHGALTLGAAALFGCRGIRVSQDSLVAERALAANAEAVAFDDYENLPLGDGLLKGARVVLMQLPRSLDALDDLAAWISSSAAPDVRVYAGGRIKHMTTAMNEVLARYFARVDVTHARQKSRLLIASEPLPSEPPSVRREFHADLGIWVCETGGTFAGTKIDIGTRALLAALPTSAPDATAAADLGCGSGVVAAVLAQARPRLEVLATDVSASAVASAAATAAANNLGNITVSRDDALSAQPAGSLDLVLLNPPFHLGATLHTGAASKLFAAAARTLGPGGELVTVFNSHLSYRAELTRVVGPTDELSRNSKFTVTRSRKR